jgi:hypothetical protein
MPSTLICIFFLSNLAISETLLGAAIAKSVAIFLEKSFKDKSLLIGRESKYFKTISTSHVFFGIWVKEDSPSKYLSLRASPSGVDQQVDYSYGEEQKKWQIYEH